MSIQSQKKNMKLLGELLSNDLGYIFGERESGPNGAKKQFLSTGRAFLSALGKDLGLREQRVAANKAGIGVSGEVFLFGMWEASGVKMELTQSLLCLDSAGAFYGDCLHIWQVKDADDRNAGIAQSISLREFVAGDYAGLLNRILRLKECGHERRAA